MGRQRDQKTGMTSQQLEFVMLVRTQPELPAYKAYMQAYPKCRKASTARVNASKLLTKANVKDFLAEQRQKDLKKWDITSDRNNKEKARLAYFNPKSLFDDDNNLLPIKDWPDEVAAAVESIQVEARREGHGDDAEIYYVHKITWAKKGPILDQISKQLGDYERDNDQKGKGMADLISAVDGNTRGLPAPVPEGEE